MSEQYGELIRVRDQEVLRMVRALAATDRRDIGDEVAWLVSTEYARRYSTPQPIVTIDEATEAAGRS